MPTVKIIGPYRFFFYSSDRDEPPHIHQAGGKAIPLLNTEIASALRASQ